MINRSAQPKEPKSKLSGPVMLGLAIVGLLFGTFELLSSIRGGMPSDLNDPMFVCSATGRAFQHKLKAGESIPVYSPYSGQNTGYPAEPCFWTADGQIKKEPNWVLLNEAVGKPPPTFCPECGRLVVGHNPVPHEGSTPPPTKQEYLARHPGAVAELLYRPQN